jgi:hypothetical protein
MCVRHRSSTTALNVTTTDHVLVLPAEVLDGAADVSVPLEAFVSVIALGRVPGVDALD